MLGALFVRPHLEFDMEISGFSPSFSLARFGVLNMPKLLSPFQTLTAFFMPVQALPTPRRGASQLPLTLPALPTRPAHLHTAPGRAVAKVHAKAPAIEAVQVINRLKVIRQLEPGTRRSQAGRMAICGRMADVCAELDRIAANESSK